MASEYGEPWLPREDGGWWFSHGISYDMSQECMERVIACVNFMDGVSTATLEKIKADPDAMAVLMGMIHNA